jgi:hypothetical protein
MHGPSSPQAGDPSGFQIEGNNDRAPFTLKLHRGEGMSLIAMNWKNGQPSQDFVGFAIEYQEPGGTQFFALNNRLGFLDGIVTFAKNRRFLKGSDTATYIPIP